MELKGIEMKVFSAKMHVECKTLFIGDICYALDEEKYDGIWGKKMGYQDGVIADDEATYAIAVGTAYGDGYYYDEKGYYRIAALSKLLSSARGVCVNKSSRLLA